MANTLDEEQAPADRDCYLIGSAHDLELFTNYLLMLTETTPFKVARVRARVRQAVELAKQHRQPLVRSGLPAAEAAVLRAWIVAEVMVLRRAGRRHMSAVLQRLMFERHSPSLTRTAP